MPVKKTANAKEKLETVKKNLSKTKPAAKTGKTKTPSPKLNANANMLNDLVEDLGLVMESFMETVNLYDNLTPKERERLIGAGVRNYGFIEKTRDIARDNPAFLPPNFDIRQFSNTLNEFDQVRQFYLVAEKLQSIASDKMLLLSSELYRESLRVYNTLREQARARVAGARDLFMALEPFFKRRRNPEKPETQKQEIHKAISMIKGKTEGEMIIKNIKPKKTGGVREVVEEELKDDVRFKEQAQGEIQK